MFSPKQKGSEPTIDMLDKREVEEQFLKLQEEFEERIKTFYAELKEEQDKKINELKEIVRNEAIQETRSLREETEQIFDDLKAERKEQIKQLRQMINDKNKECQEQEEHIAQLREQADNLQSQVNTLEWHIARSVAGKDNTKAEEEAHKSQEEEEDRSLGWSIRARCTEQITDEIANEGTIEEPPKITEKEPRSKAKEQNH